MKIPKKIGNMTKKLPASFLIWDRVLDFENNPLTKWGLPAQAASNAENIDSDSLIYDGKSWSYMSSGKEPNVEQRSQKEPLDPKATSEQVEEDLDPTVVIRRPKKIS
ncbi:MAG: hypothetical protein GY847_30575 [Proteobacteria bacterium]|nr:hypothetical protein [Pseudomonadota bacterium]